MQEEKTPAPIFAARLRCIMEQKGLTQTELAKAAGVSQNAVFKWLQGAMPSGTSLSACARALKMTVEELLPNTPEKNPTIYKQDSSPPPQSRDTDSAPSAPPREKSSVCQYPPGADMPGRLIALEHQMRKTNESQTRMEREMGEIKTLMISLLAEERSRNAPVVADDELEQKKKAG